MAETKSKLNKDIKQLNSRGLLPDMHRLRELIDVSITEEDQSVIREYAKQFNRFRRKFSVSDKRLIDLLDVEIEILIALEYGFGDIAVVKEIMKKVMALEFAWDNLCEP